MDRISTRTDPKWIHSRVHEALKSDAFHSTQSESSNDSLTGRTSFTCIGLTSSHKLTKLFTIINTQF